MSNTPFKLRPAGAAISAAPCAGHLFIDGLAVGDRAGRGEATP